MKPGLYLASVEGWEPDGVVWGPTADGRYYMRILGDLFDTVHAETIHSLRPLVVLDPESDEDCQMLMDAALAEPFAKVPEGVGRIRKILRALADPKPAEPTGLGAVVRSRDGKLWLRMPPLGSHEPWCCWNGGRADRHWNDIDVAEVLSEGWSE